ncbi:AMP-dependent synthetase and ligase [Burkholderia sp. SJ98]|nr:AMP-dependent synthetase and ligase [Burkholderia sp. SJ98]
MSPGQAAPRGTSEPHATDGIWYASYPPDARMRSILRAIARSRISSTNASRVLPVMSRS